MKKLFLFFVLSSFYSFSQDSLNVQKPKLKLSVIELEKIKVVYRGIDNPISIGVPSNVKSFIVSGPCVYTTDVIGKYRVRPGIGNELIINVEMTFLDNSVIVEEYKYQIKGLPAPTVTLNKEFSTQGNLEFLLEELKNAEVGIKFIDFIFPYNFKVTQFNIKVSHFPTLVISGNTFTDEVYELLKKVRKNDYIIISEIKTNYMSESVCHKAISPITFKIIK